MRRMILSVLAIFLLTAGVAMAQNANTTAPGPTQQREPGQTSNNLPNPGNPQTDLSNNDTYTEGGTVEGTANESMQGTAGSQTTGNVEGTTGTTGTTTGTTGVTSETEDAEGMDVDIDTGANAAGAVDVDVTRDADSDTSATGVNELGLDNDQNDQDTMDTTTGGTTYGDTGSLPDTAGELPLLALAGLLALASAFMVRFARRNA